MEYATDPSVPHLEGISQGFGGSRRLGLWYYTALVAGAGFFLPRGKLSSPEPESPTASLGETAATISDDSGFGALLLRLVAVVVVAIASSAPHRHLVEHHAQDRRFDA